MRFGKTVFTAAALCVGLSGVAFAQDSAEDYNYVGCAHMHMKFAAAVNANGTSTNLNDARNVAAQAHEYCGRGLFKQGVDGYSKAIQMLGGN